MTKITGPLSYHVETDSGMILRRHVDYLRYRYSDNPTSIPQQPTTVENSDDDWVMPDMFNAQQEPPMIEEKRAEAEPPLHTLPSRIPICR